MSRLSGLGEPESHTHAAPCPVPFAGPYGEPESHTLQLPALCHLSGLMVSQSLILCSPQPCVCLIAL